MKKQVLGLATLALLGSVAVGSVTAFADASLTPDKMPTKARVGFEEDSGGQKPVDPSAPDPEKPVKPIDPTNPGAEVPDGTAGPLSLDFASVLDFGVNKISTSNKTYFAKPQAYTLGDGSTLKGPNYVQVTDKREGAAQGWTLSVKQNGQFKHTGGDELTGAQITFTNGQVATKEVNDKIKTPSTVAPNIALPLANGNMGVALDVVKAEAGEGYSTWVYRFGNDETTGGNSIKLDVPATANAKVGEYTTTLTWLLKNAPASAADFD